MTLISFHHFHHLPLLLPLSPFTSITLNPDNNQAFLTEKGLVIVAFSPFFIFSLYLVYLLCLCLVLTISNALLAIEKKKKKKKGH